MGEGQGRKAEPSRDSRIGGYGQKDSQGIDAASATAGAPQQFASMIKPSEPDRVDRCAYVVHLEDRALSESLERRLHGGAGIRRQPIGHRHCLDARVDRRRFEA